MSKPHLSNGWYQMGAHAAWCGDGIKDMPKLRSDDRINAWLRGHTAATLEKQRYDDSKQADKAGISRIRGIIADAGQA